MELLFDIRQRILAKSFQPGVQPPTKHQLNVQARVVEHLKQFGGIDVRTVDRMGTTSGHKLLSRLREKGYLHPANDKRGFVELPNASGQGTYRWHRWTGKQ
jgi:hypothetical protein